MEVLKKEFIDAYSISDDLRFVGCSCFSYENSCFILNNATGVSLILSKSIVDMIKSRNLRSDIKLKLLQRGFLVSGQYNRKPLSSSQGNQNIPRFFFIEVTKNCNLHCKYCFRNFDLASSYGTVSDEDCDKICSYIIEFCKKNNLHRISFQAWGGEPLLCIKQLKRIRENFDAVKGLDVNFIIQTNGTLLSKENVAILKQCRINVGISLDGFEMVQNYQRPYNTGHNSFDDIICGIENLREANMGYGLLSVITKNSMEHIEDIVDFFVKKLGSKSIKFNIMRPNIYATDDMGVPYEKISTFIKRFINKIIAINEEGYTLWDTNISDKLCNLSFGFSGNLCKANGCQGGKQIISFDKYGNIYPCELTDNKDVILGNIFDDKKDLKMLIEEATKKNEYFSERKVEACDSCCFRPFCRGGCPAAIRYAADGRKIDTTECLINQALYPELIKLLLNKPKMAQRLMRNDVEFINI